MAKTIKISGIITGAELDDSFGAAYIEKGIITPVSHFVRELEEAEANGEDIEVWVNSPGGSVDSGNQMLARFQDFKGKKKVIVGALAASMAAEFVLLCGARVEIHENTRLLFHGAFGVMEGGADAMRDIAKELDIINKPAKDRLLALGVPSKTVEEGFAEGRQFVLGAEDLLAYGIAHKIREGAGAYTYKPTESEIKALAAKSARIAAYLPEAEAEAVAEETPAEAQEAQGSAEADNSAPEETEAQECAPEATQEATGEADAEPEEKPADETSEQAAQTEAPETVGPPAPVEAVDPAKEIEALIERAEHSEENARKIQSAASKRIDALTKENADLLGKLEAKTRDAQTAQELNASLNEKISALEKERETLLSKLATAKRNQAALVGNVIKDDGEQMPDWISAVRKHGTEKALKLYPDLAADFRSAMAGRNRH